MGKSSNNKHGKQQQCHRIISWMLIAILVVGIVMIPLQGIWDNVQAEKEQKVEDYFYVQIRNDEDAVVSTYKITLTGMFASASNRKITDVVVNYESGDMCQVEYDIEGYNVNIIVTHPTEGTFEKFFVLGANGRFF